MRDSASNKFVAALAIIATPFALGAFMLAWSPAAQYGLEDPKRDGYVQPRSVYDLVDKTSESTVTVWCEVSKNNGVQGTAWAIELETAVSDIYPTTLITNHHVIEDCIGGKGEVTIALPGQSKRDAIVVDWDAKNDLAQSRIIKECFDFAEEFATFDDERIAQVYTRGHPPVARWNAITRLFSPGRLRKIERRKLEIISESLAEY